VVSGSGQFPTDLQWVNMSATLWPLVHGPHEVVDVGLPVAGLAALDEVQALLGQAPGGGVELEGPQEVGALGEGRAHIVDLVHQVLDANDVVLAQLLHPHGTVSLEVCQWWGVWGGGEHNTMLQCHLLLCRIALKGHGRDVCTVECGEDEGVRRKGKSACIQLQQNVSP